MQKTREDVSRSMTVFSRHMYNGKVRLERLKSMGRLGRLTDVEQTTLVIIGS